MALPVQAHVTLDVPGALQQQWAATLDLLADSLSLPAALIMRFHPGGLEVFAANRHSPEPFRAGARFDPEREPAWQKAIDSCQQSGGSGLLEDTAWREDSRLAGEMACCWALPLAWPDGAAFGMLCALDSRRQSCSAAEQRLLGQCCSHIRLQLAAVYHEYLLTWLLQAQRDEHEPVVHADGEPKGTVQAWEYWEAADGGLTYVSPSCELMTGYRPDEFQRDPGLLSRIVFPEDRALWDEHYGERGGERERRRLEYRLVHRDGRVAWFEHVCRAVYNERGEYLGTRANQREITERVTATQHLRQSEQRLNLALEASVEGVWDWNIATGEVYFSPTWISSLGYAPAEVPGHVSFWESLIHPDDVARTQRALQAHLQGRTPRYKVENRLRKKSGEYRWNLDQGRVVEWGTDGSPLRMIGTDMDIGHRRQAQNRLKRSEALLQTVLSSIHDHVAVLDLQGRILRVNEAWIRFARENSVADLHSVLRGASYLEVCRSAAELGDPVAGEALRGIRGVLEGRRPRFELEYQCSSPEARRWFLMTVVPLLRTAGGAVVIHTDITRRYQAEAQARQREQWLSETQTIAHLASWEWDLPGNTFQWSDEMYHILDLPPGALHPSFESLSAMAHPEDRPAVRQALQGALKNAAAPCSVEHRVLRPDGSQRYVHTRGQVSVTEDNRPLRMIGSVQDISERKETELKLRHALQELEDLRDRLRAESAYLQDEIKDHHDFREIIGQSVPLRRTLQAVERVAGTGANVLLLGETGSGKELFARAIHSRSPRKHRPMIKLNCAALPSTLIESELFGHVKGAFTGALADRIGRFELADGGTLFLDEIGDLDLHLQSKLLRVLQEGELERIGSGETIRVDVRVIAATNRDLDAAIKNGGFRPDLYYRLAVFPIQIPPLRGRREDIPLLVWHFLAKKQAPLGKTISTVPREVMKVLIDYDWPGNVRELENVVERAMILSPGESLVIDNSFAQAAQELRAPSKPAGEPPSATLEDIDRAHILDVLTACKWKVKGPGNAADRLGLVPSTLRYRMKKLGIRRPK